MLWPFIIFSLPRSRSTWLSQWLSYKGLRVGHDLAAHADTFQDCLDLLYAHHGSVETGSQDAHHVLRLAMPDAKFVTIRRPVKEVCQSLAKFGITNQEREMQRRSDTLDEIEAKGAFSIPYHSLKDARICSALWEYLLDAPFDFEHWRDMAEQNIQPDVQQHLAFIASRRDQIVNLQAEVGTLTVTGGEFHRVAWEPFASAYKEALPLMEAHLRESDTSENHPLKLNINLLTELERQGMFRVMTARVNGKLVGYITWTITPDAESEGILIADQGAWYCDPEQALGRKLLDRSLKELKAAGIHSVHLHHPPSGRGQKLGSLFKRIGAKPNQTRYSLWLQG